MLKGSKILKIGIYEIRNLIDNKVYIGSSKTVNKRITMHKHTLNKNIHANKHLQAAWNKYGKIAFEFKVIQYLENEIDLLKYEQIWIDWTKCYDEKFGYNLNRYAGTNLGYKHTEEHKAKISDIHKGRIISIEAVNKLKQINRKTEKWPHNLGSKCKCKECKHKSYLVKEKWRKKKRAEGTFKRSKQNV